MEFTIGWSPKNHIPIENVDIFEKHCAVEKFSESIFIVKNLNKNSKTFINGQEITNAELRPGDQLILGRHPIEYSWLKREIERIDRVVSVDYSKEFANLKQLHIEYQEKVKGINRKYQRQDGILRMSCSLLPVVGSILLRKELGVNAYVPGCLASAFVTAAGFFTNTSSRTKEELKYLKVAFLLKYKCPKCNSRFGDIDWRLLADQKRCNSCKLEFTCL